MAVSTTLSLQGPYDRPLSLIVAATFSPEPSPDVTEFRSAVRVNGEPMLMKVRQLKKHPALLEIHGSTSGVVGPVKTLAAWMLFAEVDLRPFYRLTVKHPRLGGIASRLRGLKPIRPSSLFEMAVIAVIEQQISLAAAYRIRSRVTQRFGDHIDGLWAFPPAERLAQASLDELQDCGLSRRKSEYVSELAKRIAQGSLNLATLKRMSDDQARSFIMEQRGFGRWSADYILVRGLGRLDCVPIDDLAVRTIVGTYLGDGRRMAPEEVQEVLQPFAPFRGLATFYLLAHSRL
jgi:DNA-3-methyladenine glycosylase II